MGVPVHWDVGHLAEPALGGGRKMEPECTAGFVVVHDVTFNRGLSTAGHCANTLSYQGYALTFKIEYYALNYDFQWHDASGVTWGPTFHTGNSGSGDRTVLSLKFRAGMNVGDPVCKYGAFSDYTCGTVTSKYVCPEYVVNCQATFVTVTKNGGGTMAWNGDSGGPVFFNNVAWGLVSGREDYNGGQRLIFMPQQYIGESEVSVLKGS